METKAQKYHALIQDELIDVKDMGDRYVVAQWNEADADAGYLIDITGRMAPLGDYQFGFHHLNELLTSSDKEALRELSKIASHLEQYDASDHDDMAERFAENLGPSFQGPFSDYQAGVLDFDTLFDLASTPVSRITMDGSDLSNRSASILSDVTVDVLVKQGASWQWSQVLVASAGDQVNVSSTSVLSTSHGLVQLEPHECALAPSPTKYGHP